MRAKHLRLNRENIKIMNKKLNYDTVLAIVSVTYTATLLLVAIIALALTN